MIIFRELHSILPIILFYHLQINKTIILQVFDRIPKLHALLKKITHFCILLYHAQHIYFDNAIYVLVTKI